MSRRIDEERFLAVALEEFCARSYAEASVNTIIELSGISKGSFYYRYATKYDLYLHVLRTGVQKKWEYIRGMLAGGHGAAPRDIFAAFLAQAQAGTAFACAHPEYHRLGVMFSKEKGTELYNRAIRDLGQDGAGGLDDMVRDALARGQIRSDLGNEFVVRIVTQLLMRFDELLFENDEWSLERANARLRDFVEFLRHGLAPR